MKIIYFLISFAITVNVFGQSKPNYEVSGLSPKEAVLLVIDSINTLSTYDRKQAESLADKHGWESKEVKSFQETLIKDDSISLSKIKMIIDKNDWQNDKDVGDQINSCIHSILRTSDLATREKYLPMMREVVKRSHADANTLAIIEDKVAWEKGNKQIYGSLIKLDESTQLNYVAPLEDPDNVDKRRAAIGLEPLSSYLAEWNIKWDVVQYKKDLPKYEMMEKSVK